MINMIIRRLLYGAASGNKVALIICSIFSLGFAGMVAYFLITQYTLSVAANNYRNATLCQGNKTNNCKQITAASLYDFGNNSKYKGIKTLTVMFPDGVTQDAEYYPDKSTLARNLRFDMAIKTESFDGNIMKILSEDGSMTLNTVGNPDSKYSQSNYAIPITMFSLGFLMFFSFTLTGVYRRKKLVKKDETPVSLATLVK